MVDVPKTKKSKKRIRTLFTPEQSKLIRTKALPSIKKDQAQEEDSEESAEDEKLSDNKDLVERPQETFRIEVDLSCDRDKDKYPEISFADLVTKQDEEAESSEPEDADVKKMSEYFEKKYGGGSSKPSRRRVTDVQIDHGYDTSDPFVDDSEAFDEVIPDELDTQHGGFYINFGDLMFKKVQISESEGGTKSEVKSAPSKKRKRDEDDRKQLHKKMKTMKTLKIKEKYRKIEKDVKHKKKKIIIDNSSDSDTSTRQPPAKKPSSEAPDKKKYTSVDVIKSSLYQQKQSSKSGKSTDSKADKVSKLPKEKKVVKRKSKDILDEETAKLLTVVYTNKPFDNKKLPLVQEHLASIEFELRRNHGQSRRLFYEELIKKMGDDVDIEFSRLKNQAFGALTKKNAETLSDAVTPLQVLVKEMMAVQEASYTQRKLVYLERMDSWKLAQAEVKEGEELARPKCPQKNFKWDAKIREVFGKVVEVKFVQLKLIRAKTDEQYDLMKRYLKTLMEGVWPSGWMTINILIREAQPFCKLFVVNKKKPSVTANPIKIAAKPSKTKSDSSAAKLETKSKPTPKTTPQASPKPPEQPKTDTDMPKVELVEQPLKTPVRQPKTKPDTSVKLETKSWLDQDMPKVELVVLTSSSNSRPISYSDKNISKSSSKPVLGKAPSNSKSISDKPGLKKPVLKLVTSTEVKTINRAPKPSVIVPTSSNHSDDIAVIRTNIEKITANLNKGQGMPTVTLVSPEKAAKSSDKVVRKSPSQLSYSVENLAKSSAHLITPTAKTSASVQSNVDTIPPHFVNNLLAKYGSKKLAKIKEQGLYPLLVKEELQQQNQQTQLVEQQQKQKQQKQKQLAEKQQKELAEKQHKLLVEKQQKQLQLAKQEQKQQQQKELAEKQAQKEHLQQQLQRQRNQIVEEQVQQLKQHISEQQKKHLRSSQPNPVIVIDDDHVPVSVSAIQSLDKSPLSRHKTNLSKITNKLLDDRVALIRPSILITKSSSLATQNSLTSAPTQATVTPPRTTSVISKPSPKLSLNKHPINSTPSSAAASLKGKLNKLMTSSHSTSSGAGTLPSSEHHQTQMIRNSLGSILSQHPQLDINMQSLNKSLLKTVAARLQTFKDGSNEKK